MSAGQEFVPQNSPKRVWGTPFPKGKSGNPAGRPKSTLLMALAKFGEQKREGKTNAAWLAETAWKKAIGGDIEWAEWLADRLLGKPAQVMYASQDPALPAIWPFLAKFVMETTARKNA